MIAPLYTDSEFIARVHGSFTRVVRDHHLYPDMVAADSPLRPLLERAQALQDQLAALDDEYEAFAQTMSPHEA